MKIKLLILLAIFTVASTHAQVDVATFAKELSAKSRSVETIVCDFVETRHVDVLAADAVRRGKFSYKRPEQILLAFDSGDKILMSPNQFAMRVDGRNITSKMSSNPMLRQMQTIFGACMTGDVELLLRGGSIAITNSEKTYTLRFIPTSRSAQKYVRVVVLVFDRADMTLSELRMEQPSGDYTCYQFRDKRFGVSIDDALFNI